MEGVLLNICHKILQSIKILIILCYMQLVAE